MALEAARVEALEAAIESRPLFKLFFAGVEDTKRGNEKLDELASLLRQLEQPVRERDSAASLVLQATCMRILITLGACVLSSVRSSCGCLCCLPVLLPQLA